MPLTSGQPLSFYEILGPLGAGGMGEVYRARDTRLEREVAIKVLPEEMAEDEERLRRFEREAKMLASLNHTNIAGIHGIDQVDDTCFLAMELVSGEDLEQKLKRGALPIDEAIDICRQIAEGLEVAHEAGVVHRDLKPANVRVTPDGVVKLLDFGLAKPIRPEVSKAGGSDTSSTAESDSFLVTSEGMILGTPTYMSPEQARGKPVDRRTDIWAFGCVLYECLVGKRPFEGDAFGDLIVAILNHEADLSLLPNETPARVRDLITRCLVKDPRRRLRDVGEARLLFENPNDAESGVSLADVRDHNSEASSTNSSRTWLTLLSLALIASVAALVWLQGFGDSDADATTMHLSVAPPQGTRILFSGDFAGPPVVSPDGEKIAFTAQRDEALRQVWVRRLDEQEARELIGTEGATFPFWSTDSRELGYFDDGYLCLYDLDTDTINRVVEVGPARGGAFTEDGRLLYTKDFRSGISIISTAGDAPTELTTPIDGEHTSHRWPSAIAGTNYFIFSAVTSVVGDNHHNGIYLGTLDGGEPPRRIMSSHCSAQYLDGWLLHVKDDSLLAVRLDLDSAETRGNPIVLAKNVGPDSSTWHGQFSATTSGVLAFNSRAPSPMDGAPAGYAWAENGDRITAWTYGGRETTTYAAGTFMYSMAANSDGTMLAMDALSPDGYTDIWLCPTQHNLIDESDEIDEALNAPAVPQRLTFLPGPEYSPTWSPDGTELVFRWDGDDSHPRGIYSKRVGGGSEVLVRDNQGNDDHPSDWSPDGDYLVLTTDTLLVSQGNDIIAVPLDGGPEIPLVSDPGPQHSGQISPDGRWLAYVDSNQRSRVFVIPFAPAWPENQRDGRWLISETRGYVPRWSQDGEELYYMTDTGTLTAVSVELGNDVFLFSNARALFQSPWQLNRTFDLAPDILEGHTKQFLVLDSDRPMDGPISIVLGWEKLLEDN